VTGGTISDFLTPVGLSLKVAAVSGAAAFLLGVAAAWGMAGKRFFGRTLADAFFLLPLVLPPTVVGFLLLLLLGRGSFLGRLVESLFGHSLVFTWWAAVIASTVVAFPLVYQSVKIGILSVDREYLEAARSMGAGSWQVFVHITLPLSWRALLSGYLLGTVRGLGEFGATLMIAGNIPGRTQTIPTAIYLAAEAGKMGLAGAWTISVIAISLGFLWLINRKLS
jgi:molybdate transport system permease protein